MCRGCSGVGGVAGGCNGCVEGVDGVGGVAGGCNGCVEGVAGVGGVAGGCNGCVEGVDGVGGVAGGCNGCVEGVDGVGGVTSGAGGCNRCGNRQNRDFVIIFFFKRPTARLVGPETMIQAPNSFPLPCAGPFHKINAGYEATTTTVNSTCLMYGYYYDATLLK